MKLRILLLSIIFLFIFGMELMASSVDETMEKGSDKISLLAAIERISQEYEVYFTFDMTLVSDVSVDYEENIYSTAEEAISHILQGTNLKYKFYDQRFVILYKEDAEGLESLKQMSRHLDGLISEGERTMTAAPKREIRAIPTLSSKFLSREIQRIAFTVEGKVVDQEGEPLIGVNIQVKGSNKGTATDFDGNFVLEDIDENAVLVISYVGYQTQEMSISGRSTITIIMTSDSQLLDEVVVVGYGTQRKSDVAGSISVASMEDIEIGTSFNVLEGLKGKVGGVNIYRNTGNPYGVNGAGPRVIIRGINSITTSSDPLYVVDGVQMDNFQFLSPNEIESIEVLKDASATAIYGARGANGVILVTTKKGSSLSSEGISMTYNTWVGMGTLSKEVPVMDSYEFLEMSDRAFANIGKYQQGKDYLDRLGIEEYFVDRSDPKIFDSDGSPLYNTNWQREATRRSLSQSHDFSIQHQGSKSSSALFINYTDNQGLMINNYTKRGSVKFSNQAQPFERLKINSSLLINKIWGNTIDDTGGGLTARRTIWEMIPLLPVKFEDGSWVNSQFEGNRLNFAQEAMTNPVHELTERIMNRGQTKLFGNIGVTFKLSETIELKTEFGIDANAIDNKNYTPNNMINISLRGAANISRNDRLYWQEETYLTYNKIVDNKHRINGIAGLSWSKSTIQSMETGNTQDFETNNFGYNNLGSGSTPGIPGSGFSSWSMNSYFARGSYSFNGKYLATATLRADGSSRFGANKKYGFFPSGGIGWVISSEDFMSDINWINYLKLRTSYGRTGNTEINPYTTLSTITINNALLNNQGAPVLERARMPNPDLEWEKTDQFDLGIEFNALGNRINFEVDYYYKMTSDLLLNRPLPTTTGFTSVMSNIGRVDNSGIDFMMNTDNIEKKNFSWQSTLNINYNKNVIKKLGENNEDILTNPSFVGGNMILRVGESLSSFYGYERLGTWGTHEREEAAKINAVPGEAKRSTERKIIGNGLPLLTGSLINRINYQNFDFTLDLQFVEGVDTWQLYFHTAQDRTGYTNGLKQILYNGWTEENQNTMVQQIRHRVYAGNNTTADSHWVSDGSYLRGNLIQVGYTFNEMSDFGIFKSIRITFGAENFFLLHSKDFLGYDPEGSSNTDHFGQNVFFYQYPTAKTYALGLTVNL